MAEQFDVVVIGAGPAGYHAAIRAAQLGLKTACIDAALGKDGKPALGGTCLRVGCIPSKALLDSSRQFWNMGHIFGDHGISFKDAKIDVEAMIGRKDKIVKQFTGGIAMLFKANKVTPFYGFATLHADRLVKVKQHDGTEVELTGTNVIIAAGSESIELPFAKFDGDTIVDNVGGLDFTEVPKRLAVIGAGVIGLELGSVYRRLGTEVTVVEYLDAITPGMDAEVQKQFQRILSKQGLKFILGAAVSGVEVADGRATVTYSPKKGGDAQTLDADVVLVATGRRPYHDGLGLDALGVTLTDRGQIAIDSHFATSVPGVYAIGDVAGAPMLGPHPELGCDAFAGAVGPGARVGTVDFPASQGRRATHRKRRKSTPKNVSKCSGSCGSHPNQRARPVGRRCKRLPLRSRSECRGMASVSSRSWKASSPASTSHSSSVASEAVDTLSKLAGRWAIRGRETTT